MTELPGAAVLTAFATLAIMQPINEQAGYIVTGRRSAEIQFYYPSREASGALYASSR